MVRKLMFVRPRPKKMFDEAEVTAVRINKVLRSLRKTSVGNSNDDALLIVNLILQLCKDGRRRRAATAMRIASRVEVLLNLLENELIAILRQDPSATEKR